MATVIKSLKDTELLTGIKNGENRAFDMLYHKYYTYLLQYGRKICKNDELIKDTIQEIFLNLWTRRMHADSILYIKTYLYISLRRSLIKSIMGEKKLNNIPKHELIESYFESHAEDQIINEEWNCHVIQLLSERVQSLPHRQQLAVRLRYYDGMGCDEVARAMDLNYQSVLNHIHRSLNKLRTSEDIQQLSYYRVA